MYAADAINNCAGNVSLAAHVAQIPRPQFYKMLGMRHGSAIDRETA